MTKWERVEQRVRQYGFRKLAEQLLARENATPEDGSFKAAALQIGIKLAMRTRERRRIRAGLAAMEALR